ncbi:hypothetical protein LCGC14_1562240 [marine sediment metagenome]|uniref:Uncharacterized protein n=1 Tax=marine sediment metagenome TaxID=412755 RepID=A0A0F9LMV8_9ZZZZ
MGLEEIITVIGISMIVSVLVVEWNRWIDWYFK